ncbi:MAG: KH domain-containing protein [Anaerolineae bacterium]|nr:KH domain-containing protein [Anaerolineae bacterium]
MTAIREMVEYVGKNLATEPDTVRVAESIHNQKITVEISVAQKDKGRIIGRRGRNIKAMRALAHVLAAKHNRRASVELV